MAETKLKENIDICDICKKEVKADIMRLAGLPYRMRDSTDYKVFHMYKSKNNMVHLYYAKIVLKN